MAAAILDSPDGVLKIAAVYGPFIWTFMSFAFIPLFTHRIPTVTVDEMPLVILVRCGTASPAPRSGWMW